MRCDRYRFVQAEGWVWLGALVIAACGGARPEPTSATPPVASGSAPIRSSAAPIRFNAADIDWKDAPPGLPSGSKTAVLEGDPRRPGFFTMRIELPAGSRLDPHSHPADERVTVVSGSVHVGFGETFDPAKGKTFTAGAFYINPTPMQHFVWTDEGCVLQVTGIGPWGLTFIPSTERKSR